MSNRQPEVKYSLYHYRACPFCAITKSALKHIDLDVSERDIQRDSKFRSELIRGGGKAQVPCLKIETGSQVRWLYESRDIIEFLNAQAKHSRRAG